MIFFYSCILGFFLWYEEICFVLGEYVQNLCPANSPSCVSCPKRLPSCVGLPGTQEGFPGKLWQADYIVCDTNRTMNISQCPSGEYFNPRLKKCMKKVPNGRFWLLKGRCEMMHYRCKKKVKNKMSKHPVKHCFVFQWMSWIIAQHIRKLFYRRKTIVVNTSTVQIADSTAITPWSVNIRICFPWKPCPVSGLRTWLVIPEWNRRRLVSINDNDFSILNSIICNAVSNVSIMYLLALDRWVPTEPVCTLQHELHPL